MNMTYDEALEFIYSHRKFQKSSGHERIRRLLELADNPHKNLHFIHVVGTNGKGSVCTALSCILRQAGYTTGLFTSPFVLEFGERIRVNGEMIPKSAVASITSMLKEKILLMEKEELFPTVFEVITALAMVYFSDMNCDAVILEAGIGGGKDSTNVIERPSLAVITSVSLDHTEVLGDTTQEIAKEKCGIIKGGCPVVSYPFENSELPFTPQNGEAAEVIRQQCLEKESILHLPDTDSVRLIKNDLTGTELYYGELHINSRVCGSFQIANLITAVKAAEVLSDSFIFVDNGAIERGIADFFIPGRLECVSREPLIILDAGHNEGAVTELTKNISDFADGRKTVALCAFMKDKDYSHCLKSLAPLCDEMVFTLVDSVRGENPEILCEKAADFCKENHFRQNFSDAFDLAKEKAGETGLLLVCGSFYLVSDIRNKYFPD